MMTMFVFLVVAVVMLLNLERTLREREGTPPVICQRVASTFLQPGSAHASSTFFGLVIAFPKKKKPEGPSNDGWPAAVAFARSTNVFEARNSEERVLGVFVFVFIFFWLDE